MLRTTKTLMDRPRCDRTPAWAALQQHFDSRAKALDMRQAFAADSERFAHFSQSAPYVFADLSKNLWDRDTESLLFDLAHQCELEAWRDALFDGAPINRSEERAAMHFLLRIPPQANTGKGRFAIDPIASELPHVHATLNAMLAYAEQVRANAQITDIVNIGIGGSDLGPQMAVLALGDASRTAQRFHFVSSVDAEALSSLLAGLQPQHTLFIVASKTFSTAETLSNAQSAKHWFEAQGGQDFDQHFLALTAQPSAAARTLGISTCFELWDWVGGRYSLCSAIGLPLAIAIGAADFREFLAGAHAMDEHFRTAPLARNLPIRLGLLDVWYRNFYGFNSRSIAPYSQALHRLPAYLQQLEMESNGKRVDMHGDLLPFATAPVLWGEPGTNGQHAYFQLLHQGTAVVPVEFIALRQARHGLPGHAKSLLSNALAQARALLCGEPDGPMHRQCPGNRPSTFLLLEQLTPASLGALIALQEHRVFVSGAIWGINSFDQWGVELGKVLAEDMQARLASGEVAGLDGSSAGLLRRLRGVA